MSEVTTNFHYESGATLPGHKSDYIDLRDILSIIADGKWIILTITFCFAIFSVALALYLPNIYRSEALLAPANSEQNSSFAGLAGQFGGLASLAGINLGSSSIDKTTMALEVMKSREFVSQFIERRKILIPLMAVKGWESNQNKLILDDNLYDESSGEWIREPKPRRPKEPTMQEAFEVFSDILVVRQDSQTNFVTISIEHYSPYIAQQWVSWLVESINNEMKRRDLIEAQRSIKYLSEKLIQTKVSDMKSILYQLIEEQTKTIMFAEVRDEYIFKTVDPAVVPELKVKPKRPLICVLGTLLGMFFGVVIVLIKRFLIKEI
ncbi:Wzz/FepE/Etk N-terminal domain-containing protein [Ferrimonas kyonanensis]|uniref:Wzz/FepE/Etk N-terminal domain-containing protein n=1 Tax=Ferrimonas kyonanensis TaxID=364763 RepID=UPI0003F96A45|nr:Wzz/FepE/Etk N-terminal domain-containing protein [Ferrimonas kyonanensis]